MRLKYIPDNEILDVVITSSKTDNKISIFSSKRLEKTVNFHDYEWHYDSIEDFNKDWEDYKEPKGDALNLIILTLTNFIENEPDDDKVDIEDCKKMLEKLKALERLKNEGFRFNGYDVAHNSNNAICGQAYYKAGDYCVVEVEKDLDLLFGGDND